MPRCWSLRGHSTISRLQTPRRKNLIPVEKQSGFKLSLDSFGGQYSIQLSYGRVRGMSARTHAVGVKG